MTPTNHLTTAQLTARYRVCRRTIGRWAVQPNLNFPQPLVINGRRYWREDALEAWEHQQIRT